MSETIKIDTIRNIVKDKKFIEKFVKGNNIPLNFDAVNIEVEDLANGEYNYNFKLNISVEINGNITYDCAVFRLNYGSQMGITNQIEYEFNALNLLSVSGITPKPIFFDDSRELIDRDYLVMSFVNGVDLDYKKDLIKAAEALVKIHTTKLNTDFKFVMPDSPFEAIIDECTSMFSVYKNSKYFDEEVEKRVNTILNKAKSIVDEKKSKTTVTIDYCFINTELNSSNFLVDGEKCSIVDWEKPIIGEKEQDLGHFLAPTTTFWKTDIILSKEEIDIFLESYYKNYINRLNFNKIDIDKINNEIIDKSIGNCNNTKIDKNSHHMVDENSSYRKFKDKVYEYIIFNCLRGVTWCSMAWVEYNSNEKTIVNEFTFNKLKEYLKYDFLDNIIKLYIKTGDLDEKQG